MTWAGWTLLAPWALAGLVALPVLILLLRLLPPAPRTIRFPSLFLLTGIVQHEKTPERTPLWLLILRALLIIAVILGAAHPVERASNAEADITPRLLVIDNGWAGGRVWPQLKSAVMAQLGALDPGTPVWFLPTAPSGDDGQVKLLGPFTPPAARNAFMAITPQPWPPDHPAAQTLLNESKIPETVNATWYADGIRGPGALDLLINLQQRGPARLFGWPHQGILTLSATQVGGDLQLLVHRTGDERIKTYTLVGKDNAGGVVWHQDVAFSAGQRNAAVQWLAPADVQRRIQSIHIGDERTAAAAWLLDSRRELAQVGIVGNQTARDEQPLLSDIYYLERALQPVAQVSIGTLDELLEQELSALFITDASANTEDAQGKLKDFVEDGGVLVRFANAVTTRTGEKADELLPVGLRAADRTLGGALSWTKPQTLSPFPPHSPFAGLAVPDDIQINRQILAEPSTELSARTWAALNDGTPLITGKTMGRGQSVLVHVTAQADWSNLPLSGLFVGIIKRLTDLAMGQPIAAQLGPLYPDQVLNGFGEWQPPGKAAKPIEGAELSAVRAEPAHPPGLYSSGVYHIAHNLGASIDQPELWADGLIEDVRNPAPRNDLQPWLFGLAALLLLIDALVIMGMQYGFRLSRAKKAAAAAALALFFCLPAHAADTAADKVTLAFIRSGDTSVDAQAQLGLETLARELIARTMISAIGVQAIDPASDELAFYPLIYWPIAPQTQPPSIAASQNLNAYLGRGGMLLVDTRQGDSRGNAMLQRQLQGILDRVAVPELVPIPVDHVLFKTFYLLKDFPGRLNAGEFWVAASSTSLDQVAPVLIGGNDWAAGWAENAGGRPAFTAIPGGPRQHEMALRFGVNLVMYALTGNYKADQIHSAALLQRQRREQIFIPVAPEQ